MDNRSMMETEEEEQVFKGEDIMESEEEEEEEVEQLEEMKPPVVTSWMGPDGVTVHGVICIDDGIIRLKNQCRSNDCSICYKPSTTHGKHRICCLPCGHTYGFSCIKKWLLQSSSGGKCPQCNAQCSFQDAILLYPPRLCVTDHQKASSAAFFPFTKQGYLEFTKYESSRLLASELLLVDDIEHMNILGAKQNYLADRADKLARQWDFLSTLAERLEERAEYLGVADALRSQASLLKPQVEALGRRIDALGRLISALRRRIDALELRSDAFKPRMIFYAQMHKEHHKREEETAKAKQGLERKKKKLAEMAAAKPEMKGEKEAEKSVEKMLKDNKDMKDEKKMQAFGTVDVPEEEMVEAVAQEPEEEKVEVKAEPEMAAAKPEMKGEKEAEKAVEKMLKDNKDMKDGACES